MNFEKKDNWKYAGYVAGFIGSYLIFTTILSYVLKFNGRISLNPMGYVEIMGLTASIIIVGKGMRAWLK